MIINTFYSKFYNKNKFLEEQIQIFNNLGWNYNDSLKSLNKILIKNELDNFDDSKVSMISQHLIAFCSIKKKPKRILEIGTYDGFTSFLLSKIFPESEIITLDLNDNSNIYNKTYNRSNKNIKSDLITKRNLNIQDSRIKFIQDNSFNLPKYNLKNFDLIWVDGDHNYPALAWDICNAFNLLNENGYLLCDDIYFNRSETHHILNYLQNEKIIQVSYILKRVSNIFSANPFIRKHIAIIKKT
ncbi:MAG: hypothetical protein CFH22_00543 [Alphaproteobacteria bacterium MarineAlpha5_Bin12]|nr:MAG: hypothetical protein CFH22_00543 [Alphaproteobacteria bacterium MarineAlpha5_Bin12]|tara:strand:+ start:26416 stop:27141 length:726 start_codon:yes stop_codon:yes gene_type:complete